MYVATIYVLLQEITSCFITDIQQSILMSYCASVTEMEGNTIVGNSKNKIKKKEYGREGFKDCNFLPKSILITCTFSATFSGIKY